MDGQPPSCDAAFVQRDERTKIVEVLTDFYSALLGRGDLAGAARWVAPGFRLKPNGVVGFNLSLDDPNSAEIAESLLAVSRQLASKVPPGAPEDLLELIYEQRGGENRRYPFEFWHVKSIEIEGEDQAHAVTKDASSGLRRVDDHWRMAWLLY